MITKELFIKFINNAKAFDKELDRWHDFGIDIFELPISDYAWKMYDCFLEENFTSDGIDIINWWMFEKYMIPNKPNELYDSNNNVIPTNTIEELWECIKNDVK